LELSHKMLNLDVYKSKSLLRNVQLIDMIKILPRHINANGTGEINFNVRHDMRQRCFYAKPANGN